MNILVTGGAGYIGSVVVEQLIRKNHTVTVYDNLSLGHRAAVHEGANFVQGELNDKKSLSKLFESQTFDGVMHFAAKSLVGESMERPFYYLSDNVSNTMNLLECVIQYEVPKLIFSSTANLFSAPNKIPIDEMETIHPGSPYGESKYTIERALDWLSQIHASFNYASLRYFNAAGASERFGEDHSPELHLIPLVLQVALEQRDKIYIFGDDYDTPDGTCIRDYIHVIDLAEAHILALDAINEESKIYNLGNGSGYSVKEVIETCRLVTGHPIPSGIKPRRLGDPAKLIACSERIKKELNWVPSHPNLEQIIESAWNWHKNNPNGY